MRQQNELCLCAFENDSSHVQQQRSSHIPAAIKPSASRNHQKVLGRTRASRMAVPARIEATGQKQ